RRDLIALSIHPRTDLETEIARDERRQALVEQVEGVGPVATAELEDVTKSPCGDQRRLRAASFQGRVDGGGGAVLDEGGVRQVDRGVVERLEDGGRNVPRRRQHLRGPHFVRPRVIGYEVGERTSDVDTHRNRVSSGLRRIALQRHESVLLV